MSKRVRDSVPVALVASVEDARKDLLALFRALDQPYFARFALPQQPLRQLLELDADLAEALAVLDRPLGSLRVKDMVVDTQRSLRRVPQAQASFLGALEPEAHAPLQHARTAVHASLRPIDAYHAIPGIDPTAG